MPIDFIFPARVEPNDEGGFIISFRDIPEALTEATSEENVDRMAADALITAMDFYFEDHRAVPLPSSPQPGEISVELPLSVIAKVLLLNEIIAQKIRPADLARRMGIPRQEMTRIMDLKHTTKIDTLSAAFKALGKKLRFSLD